MMSSYFHSNSDDATNVISLHVDAHSNFLWMRLMFTIIVIGKWKLGVDHSIDFKRLIPCIHCSLTHCSSLYVVSNRFSCEICFLCKNRARNMSIYAFVCKWIDPMYAESKKFQEKRGKKCNKQTIMVIKLNEKRHHCSLLLSSSSLLLSPSGVCFKFNKSLKCSWRVSVAMCGVHRNKLTACLQFNCIHPNRRSSATFSPIFLQYFCEFCSFRLFSVRFSFISTSFLAID